MPGILSVGYPFAPVSPHAVGGAEQVLAAVDRGLTDRGVRSIVLAPEGSRCRGELRPTPLPGGPLTAAVQQAGRAAFGDAVDACCRREQPDVLHFHGTDVAAYLPPPGAVPIVVTLHLWPDRYPADLLTTTRDDVHLVCVSGAQRAIMPDPERCLTIRNGVDLALFRPGPARGATVFLAGRICPEKGFHLAIDAARAAGLPVVLAGEVYPYTAHQAYFRDVIAPRLGADVRFVGRLAREAMSRALASAACVAIPSTIPETSSLAAMEALASGTPVVAFRTPALAELIEDGRTGVLVDAPEELAGAFVRARAIASAACRRVAEARCAAGAMIAGYLDLYGSLAPGFPPRAERVA